MNEKDPALIFSNPRLLAAVYFGLLSVVGTILIDAFLISIGIEDLVPLFQAILLGMVIASITGAISGKLIIHCPKPYKTKTFLVGFVMVLASLPFFALGLMLFMMESENPISIITSHDSVSAYFIILGYSYLLFGFFLAIASGLASMYLRGQLVYHILHTDKRRSHRLPRYIRVKEKIKPQVMSKRHVVPEKHMHHKKLKSHL